MDQQQQPTTARADPAAYMRAYRARQRAKVPAEAMAALPDGSNRQIAAAAGVSEGTIRNHRGAQISAPDAEPARVIGADGKSYPGRVVREVTAEIIEPMAHVGPRAKRYHATGCYCLPCQALDREIAVL